MPYVLVAAPSLPWPLVAAVPLPLPSPDPATGLKAPVAVPGATTAPAGLAVAPAADLAAAPAAPAAGLAGAPAAAPAAVPEAAPAATVPAEAAAAELPPALMLANSCSVSITMPMPLVRPSRNTKRAFGVMYSGRWMNL